jgi:uncharacterized protein YdbL (DUF1318 family)
MTKHTSTYPGTLVLPDGTEVKLGGSVPISADLAKNEGVVGWIESGWLVPVNAKAEADAKAAQPAMPTGKK